MKAQVTRTEKKCSRCDVVKPIIMFAKSKDSVDGHIYHCKECEKKRRKNKNDGIIVAFDYYE
jgi:hypothetical protein